MCRDSTAVLRMRVVGYNGAPRTCAKIVKGIGERSMVKARAMTVG